MIRLLPILAQNGDEGDGGWSRLIVIGVMLALGGLGWVIEKMKEKQQRDQAAGREQPVRPPKPPVAEKAEKGESVADIVRTMRQASTRRPAPKQPAPAQPAPRRPAAVRKAPHENLAKRHLKPRAVGGGVKRELNQMSDQARRQAASLRRRLGGEAEAAPAVVGKIVEIDLQDLDEVRRGVVYSEILAPPVSLRKSGGLWDL